jgi:CubicO group peptidase (beta-lactamase class C family)
MTKLRPLPILCLLGTFLATQAAASPTAPIVRGDLGKKADAWLMERAASGFSGLVLLARGDDVLLEKGYGLADREKKVPMTPDTIFSIGSITKQFTAAAILKLEMQGKLETSDNLGAFFPAVPADKARITLHQLLTHTSGLESDFAGDYDAAGRDAYVRLIFASKLRTEPGATYFYANSGYSVLAAVVEIVSGRPYETFLQEEMFHPAGMMQTGYKAPKWDPARQAVGYRGAERWGTILEKPWAPDGPYWALRGNGGIHTTLEDLRSWHRALGGDAILSKDAKAKLFKPWVAEDPSGESHYGYGWAVTKTKDGRSVIMHNGGNGIFSADLRRYVDDDLLIVTFSNASDVKATPLARDLYLVARGETVPGPVSPRSEALPASAFDRSVAQRRAWAYLEAFGSGDVEKMRAWRGEHMAAVAGGMTEEQRDARFKEMFAEMGKLVALRIQGETADELTIVARSKGGETVELGFLVTPAPEQKVRGIRVKIGGP